MKAVILAGGEGSRLRPLTIGRPKPMAPLLGKPVLGHILDLLRRHGVTQVALTLRTLPAAITDHFGDGAEYGVKLTYFVEQEPLGTAGGVRQCRDFLGEEDFLVLSGDGVCDLDLGAFMALHQSRGSAASLALCRRSEPLEYGLVRTDDAGRVLGFLEKPGWGQVDTELVNTGIYLLSRRCMEQVPAGVEYDFGRDLFPALLQRGEVRFLLFLFVGGFLVQGGKAVKGHGVAAGLEVVIRRADGDRHGILLAVCHLAGHKAAPDHAVELCGVAADALVHLVGRQGRH